MYCKQCGKQIPDEAVICVNCGVATGRSLPTQQGPAVVPGAKSRMAYILLGIFLGTLGIHNFYAGYTSKAIAQLLITIFLFWLILPVLAIWIWVIVEVCTINKDARGVPFGA